jgi:hypothetical protein
MDVNRAEPRVGSSPDSGSHCRDLAGVWNRRVAVTAGIREATGRPAMVAGEILRT